MCNFEIWKILFRYTIFSKTKHFSTGTNNEKGNFVRFLTFYKSLFLYTTILVQYDLSGLKLKICQALAMNLRSETI